MRPFADKWNQYLQKFYEYSDRDWRGETPLGRLEWLDPCASVLDIGCGVGNALRELKDKGKQVLGVDVTPKNIPAAMEKHGIEVRLGDMHDLPVEDESVDGILMWDVFEHNLAPLVVLWECHRVLKVGGRLLLYTPPECWADHPVHTIIPTRNQMGLLFKKANFTVDAIVDDLNNGSEYHCYK